jgi:hypothetical protein
LCLSGYIWLAPALIAAVAIGCKPESKTKTPRGPAVHADVRDALFDTVADNLNRLEEFDVNQMMPQICDRLNQWYYQEKPNVAWHRDALIEKLPDELQKLRVMQTLDLIEYRMIDAWYLQEAVWLRDISNGARGDAFDDVDVAMRLFDWTVRNISLEPDDSVSDRGLAHRPFETLLLGRGNTIDRDWVFMLLARQQGLDVVLLGIADEDGKNVRPWLPALLSNKELYLFDCRLGLPIPGPDGKGVATLSQVVADEQLLRKLDLDAEHAYPIKAEDLKHLVALVEASPHSLSRRMALVESRLAGDKKMALTSPGEKLAEEVKESPHVTDARLWTHPFDIWAKQSTLTPAQLQAAAREMAVFQGVPTLMTGRALYFKGSNEGEQGSKVHMLNARPADSAIEEYRLPKEVSSKLKREEIPQHEAARIVVLRHAKQDASFWLGLICYAEEEYPSAIDYFAKRTLEAMPDGPWTHAARYNLARSYEAIGKTDEAIALLESDVSPQSHGNKLRAKMLRERQKPAAGAASAADESVAKPAE